MMVTKYPRQKRMGKLGTKSEYQPWVLELERANDYKKLLGIYFISLADGDVIWLKKILKTINELWKFVRPITHKDKRGEFDKRIQNLRRKIKLLTRNMRIRKRHYPYQEDMWLPFDQLEKLEDEINAFAMDIFDWLQVKGIGLRVKEPLSSKKLGERSFGISGD